jgi:hypothetical protein
MAVPQNLQARDVIRISDVHPRPNGTAWVESILFIGWDQDSKHALIDRFRISCLKQQTQRQAQRYA